MTSVTFGLSARSNRSRLESQKRRDHPLGPGVAKFIPLTSAASRPAMRPNTVILGRPCKANPPADSPAQ